MRNVLRKFIKENKNNLLFSLLIINFLVVTYIVMPSFQEQVDIILKPKIKIKGAISLTEEEIALKLRTSKTQKLDEQSKNGLETLCEQSIQTALGQAKVLFPMLHSTEFIWSIAAKKELNQCINRWDQKLHYE